MKTGSITRTFSVNRVTKPVINPQIIPATMENSTKTQTASKIEHFGKEVGNSRATASIVYRK